MAIREGFKQTEAGVIPADWIAEKLGQHVKITSGESPSMFSFKDDGIPYFKVEQLNNGSKYLSETPYRIDQCKTVPDGSLIFPKRGASILLNKIRIVKKESYMDTNLMALTVSDFLDNEFLFYMMSHIELWKIADTTSIPQINNKHIKPLIIPLPPTKAEQEAIAEALSDADGLIESLEQLIDKKRLIKQGAMQELLTGKRRLPGFEVEPGMKKTKFGKIPKDWDMEPIGSHFSFKNGLNKAKQFFGYGTPIVNYLDVFEHDGLLAKDIQGKVSLTSEEIRNYSAQKGDVFFTRTSETLEEIGISSVLLEDLKNAVFSGFILRARATSNKVSLLFRKYCFNSYVVRKQIVSRGTYTTRALTNGRSLAKVKIPLPPTADEQVAIASILSDMDTEITELEAKLTKARKIKQGMMQELLTGRIRLV
jgi:type I restriction enzyme S subunit